MTDVAEIARSLTKARVKGLLAMSPTQPAPYDAIYGSARAEMFRKGLLRNVRSYDGLWMALTPLGLAVRDYLTQEQPR